MPEAPNGQDNNDNVEKNVDPGGNPCLEVNVVTFAWEVRVELPPEEADGLALEERGEEESDGISDNDAAYAVDEVAHVSLGEDAEHKQ